VKELQMTLAAKPAAAPSSPSKRGNTCSPSFYVTSRNSAIIPKTESLRPPYPHQIPKQSISAGKNTRSTSQFHQFPKLKVFSTKTQMPKSPVATIK